MIRNYQGNPKWLTGTILAKCTPLTYQVKTDSGHIWRHHIDQLRAASPGTTNNCENIESLIDAPPIERESSNLNNSVQDSTHFTQSTFADRYPVWQHRPLDHYGVSE